MAKRYLVTGAAGFIGSHTAEALLARGDQVVGIDNLNDYYDPARKRRNLEEVRAATGGRLDFRELDIRDADAIHALFAGKQYDAVIHLAAMAGVRASMDQPQLYLDVNLGGTLNLLEASRHHPPGNFVFASTSSAYGNTTTVPFVETDNADRPLAPYPATKRAAELLGYSYHHLHGLPFTALRFFTVYGPRGRPDMMAYKLVDGICRGSAVPLYNRGDTYRDWTYVGDIVSGVVAAADKPLGYEIINLGRGRPILLRDFIKTVESLLGHEAVFDHQPMPGADMERTYANTDKARDLLGYAPRVTVDEGVRAFWQWFQRECRGEGASSD